MHPDDFKAIQSVLEQNPSVLFAYLCGSAKDADAFNDIDVAVYAGQDSDPLGLSADIKKRNHHRKTGDEMKAEFTAIIEPAPEGGYWAICPEVPGANGQGETIEETKNSLREAIQLILEDRKADILRGLPEDAIQETVLIG